MIKVLLEEKYGKEMISNLIDNGRINRDNEAYKGTKSEIVNSQMKKMIDLGLLNESDFNEGKPWAFDVSSTYADISKAHRIPIMIVGEDPHVQDNDYQCVYGFAQKGAEFDKNQIKDKFKKFLIRLFLSQKEIDEMSNNQMCDFLSNFYVTDLCHFTPQGLDKRKEELKNWTKIKENTARHFLIKEIEAINPQYIITHGGVSRNYISKILGVKIVESGLIGNKYYLGKYKDTQIIGISHLGSGHTTGHWNKYIDLTRESLIKDIIRMKQ